MLWDLGGVGVHGSFLLGKMRLWGGGGGEASSSVGVSDRDGCGRLLGGVPLTQPASTGPGWPRRSELSAT